MMNGKSLLPEPLSAKLFEWIFQEFGHKECGSIFRGHLTGPTLWEIGFLTPGL